MKIQHTAFIIGLVCLACLGVQLASVQSVTAANCTQNASKQCISNIVYWYDSCGAVQSIYQNCNTTNQVCQNGACVAGTTDTNTNTTQHSTTKCYNNNVYWYDSNGLLQDLYKNCNDNNSCTTDSCANSACSNVQKCDGSTCAQGSADYIKYCATTTTTTTSTTGKNQNPGVVMLLFAKKDSEKLQWEKSVDANNNDTIDFVLAIKNTSVTPVDNVVVKITNATDVIFAPNVTIDNFTMQGDIVSGITLGTIAPNTAKSLSFTGTVQEQSQTQQTAPQNQMVQASVLVNSSTNVSDSDFVVINTQQPQANTTPITQTTDTVATTKTASTGSPIVDFIKQWYLLAVVVIVIIGLFIIIFKRLSSQT
jgi:hypothetical protein